jgi:outer membrane protein assembly factor BamB
MSLIKMNFLSAGPQKNRIACILCSTWLLVGGALQADDWPQWLGPKRDSVWRETGILRKFPAAGPAVRWRTPIAAGYAGPAVANGRVFVCDRVKGDPGMDRVLCLDEASGKVLWQHTNESAYTMSYAAGPRATPIIAQGKVYTFGGEGYLSCLDAATGQVLWARDCKRDYQAKTPMWGFSANPLLDGQKLICLVGGKQSLVVALDKDTGKEIWHAQEAREPGYCPPTIIEVGQQRQLIIFQPEALMALEPESGKTLWSEPYNAKAGMTIATPRLLGDHLFVTTFYSGPMMVRLAKEAPAATLVWRGKSNNEQKTDGLHCVSSTPFLEGDCIFGVCSYGQLRCLDLHTGERLWETLAATTDGQPVRWANAFIVKNGDVFFLANEKGDLIIARLSRQGYTELSRAHLLEPTNRDCGRPVVWSHPAFANRCVYMRNDREIICVSLAER